MLYLKVPPDGKMGLGGWKEVLNHTLELGLLLMQI